MKLTKSNVAIASPEYEVIQYATVSPLTMISCTLNLMFPVYLTIRRSHTSAHIWS